MATGGVSAAHNARSPSTLIAPIVSRVILGAMSIKSDRWIRRMAREHRMIEPFSDRQIREGVISYGVSSYGYDEIGRASCRERVWRYV